MKLRFIEEYNPITGKTHFNVEQKKFLCGWLYVSNTLEISEEKARAVWERCKKLKSIENTKKVLETIG